MRSVAFDQQNAVGADAAMPIAQCASLYSVEWRRCAQRFHDDKVVSETLVLGKPQRHALGSSTTGQRWTGGRSANARCENPAKRIEAQVVLALQLSVFV